MPYPIKWIRNKMHDVKMKRAEKQKKYFMESLENQTRKRWYYQLVCFTIYVSVDDEYRNREPERTATIAEKYNIAELFSDGDKRGENSETKMKDEEFMVVSLQKSEPVLTREALNVNEVMVNL